ncbi:STAS domain-containing protein [Streptomyces fulvorobeus]|uniref:Anti-sigma factor antagonist n=1 Tax=Streptomyces fulvorobeus TaxID=284028 RepID=A0A7J0C1B8_9ACTN|nr:STAS domain-containing protein [Streptomyces fulvorobeus]NYE39924.1 anti-sigma B factor antagonist [Streptomyces fulvorobeus]GFM96178.1 anti-sigma factor antagonist [Streptomyces fulvorobeus]
MTEDLHLAVEHTHGSLTVTTVTGEISFRTAPHLRARGLELIGQGHHQLVLDLSDVGFCDSAGLSALIGIWHAAQGAGGTLALAAVPDRLMRVLTLTGLHTVLPAYATVADALAAHQRDTA